MERIRQRHNYFSLLRNFLLLFHSDAEEKSSNDLFNKVIIGLNSLGLTKSLMDSSDKFFSIGYLDFLNIFDCEFEDKTGIRFYLDPMEDVVCSNIMYFWEKMNESIRISLQYRDERSGLFNTSFIVLSRNMQNGSPECSVITEGDLFGKETYLIAA